MNNVTIPTAENSEKYLYALIALFFLSACTPPEKSKDCPNWSGSSTDNFFNTELSNFGCATKTNLGKMLLNPEDAEGGVAKKSAGYSERGADAVRKYRGAVADSPAASDTSSGAADTAN